jgi:hypothetical protein
MVTKNIDISVINLFTTEALGISGNATSSRVDMSNSSGSCQLQYLVTGTGTLKIEAVESVDGTAEIVNGTPLGTTLSGSGFVTYDAAGIPYVKFKITEDGGAAAATITLDVAVS